MGINWNNLGAGLAVWGNVLKDLAEERKKEQEEERMAQTLGQIMAIDTQVQQGQEPLSAQFVEETKPRQLVQEAIPDIMKTLNPEQQVQMFSALRGYKSEWADKLDKREIIDFQVQDIKKAMENPLIAKWGEDILPMIENDPYNKGKFVESVWNKVQDFKQAPYKAQLEMQAELEAGKSDIGQEYILWKNLNEVQKERLKENLNKPEEFSKTLGDIRQENINKMYTVRDKVDKIVQELNKFKTSDESIAMAEQLISKNLPVKSAANKNGIRLEDKFTGHEIINAVYPFWDSAGRPPEITNEMMMAGVRTLIKETRPEGEQYEPRPEFMGQINEFMKEINNSEDIRTIFHNVGMVNQRRQKDEWTKFAIAHEIRTVQSILADYQYAVENGFDEQAKDALAAFNNETFTYLDFASLDEEKGSMQVKEDYNGLVTQMGKEAKVDLNDNVLALPSSTPISIFAPDPTRETTIPITVQDAPQVGLWGDLDIKAKTWGEFLGQLPKEKDVITMKGVKEFFTPEEGGIERLEALQRTAQEQTKDPQHFKLGLKARLNEQQINNAKRAFEAEFEHDAPALKEAPWHSKSLAWDAIDPQTGDTEPKRRVFDPNEKAEFYQAIQEYFLDMARENRINIDRVDINDPALEDIKSRVDRLWEEMWSE